ncbi:MAG: hypothetical protein PHP62_00780 [Candidatus Moranbacteria bacterium]|nr:hypothetical protein [Candidatus Moranbacteria bacterium]
MIEDKLKEIPKYQQMLKYEKDSVKRNLKLTRYFYSVFFDIVSDKKQGIEISEWETLRKNMLEEFLKTNQGVIVESQNINEQKPYISEKNETNTETQIKNFTEVQMKRMIQDAKFHGIRAVKENDEDLPMREIIIPKNERPFQPNLELDYEPVPKKTDDEINKKFPFGTGLR